MASDCRFVVLQTFPALNMSDLIPVRLAVGVALATAGQVLNGGVYNALGKQPCKALERI